MKDILSREGMSALARFSEERVLLGFDYDGTLSPIVVDPAEAEMRATTRQLLSELARLYPCAVISGRARADVVSRLAGIELRAIVGNHGAEPLPGAELSLQVNRWRSSLEPSLVTVPGIEIEDKHLSLSVHYRRSANKDRARGAILHATRLLDDARIVRGKQVVNVLPFGARHKGAALDAILKREECACAFYIGDDYTDEDVFALAKDRKVIAVRVGRKRTSLATHYLKNQMDIDRLMEVLIGLRRT